jgi:hypothetical protein
MTSPEVSPQVRANDQLQDRLALGPYDPSMGLRIAR